MRMGDFLIGPLKSCALRTMRERTLAFEESGQICMLWHLQMFNWHVYLARRNIIHGSDSVESANKEIGLWFKEGITSWRPASVGWVYEKPEDA